MIPKIVSAIPLRPSQEQQVEIPAGSVILGVTRGLTGLISLNVLHNEEQPVKETKTIVALPYGETYSGGLRLKSLNPVLINSILFHFFEAV